MKKILYITILGVFLASCSSKNPQESLISLQKKQNELKQQLTQVNEQIATLKQNSTNNSSTKETLIKTTTIKPSTFQHFIKAQGTVITDNNIYVPAQAPGIVTNIFINEGDKIKKGQILATIDDAIYKKQLDELLTGYALAKTIFERQERLWKKEIGSEIQYLQAKNQKESLEKKIETVKEQLKKLSIISPINGTVDEIVLKKGEMASPGISGVRVIQMSDLKITAHISEKYFGLVKKGDIVSVQTENSTVINNLHISIISKVINPENRTFTVEINIPSNIKEFSPNMLVKLQICDYQNDNAIVAPINIVKKNNNKEFLYIAEKKGNTFIARKRNIETGIVSNTTVEILKGLNVGDKIITTGYHEIVEGEIVVIK